MLGRHKQPLVSGGPVMGELPDYSKGSWQEKASRIPELREAGYNDFTIARILGWRSKYTVTNQLSRWRHIEGHRERTHRRYRRNRGDFSAHGMADPEHTEAIAFWRQHTDWLKENWATHTAQQLADMLTESTGRKVTRNAVIGKLNRIKCLRKKQSPLGSSTDGTDKPIRYADAVKNA